MRAGQRDPRTTSRRMIRVGVSGWECDGWQGDFHPDDLPPSNRLAHLAGRLDTAGSSRAWRFP